METLTRYGGKYQVAVYAGGPPKFGSSYRILDLDGNQVHEAHLGSRATPEAAWGDALAAATAYIDSLTDGDTPRSAASAPMGDHRLD
jgi:hypothetical protein